MSELNKLRNALKKAQNAKANLNIEYQGSSNNQRLTLDNNIKDANQSVKNAQKALANAEAASGKQEAVAEAASSNSAAANSSASAAETADPPNIKSRLIRVKQEPGANGKPMYTVNVVEEASSSSGLNKTPPGNAANPNMLRTKPKTDGGRRKRSHRKRSHKRTHKTHKRSHKSHKRIHR